VPTFEIPGFGHALQALENKRKSDFEGWLIEKGLDIVVWACNEAAGCAEAYTNEASAQEAWRNRVLHSMVIV
jgi:amidase